MIEPCVWFPAIRAGSGADVFTERLCAGLNQRGIRAEITWLPLRAEYAPWTVPKMIPPPWANIVHVNTWLPFKLLPTGLPIVATVHHAVHLPNLGYKKGLLRSAYHQFWIAPNERRILACADRVIAVSSFVARATRQTLLDRTIRVIGNGVDADRFSPSDKPPSFSPVFRLLYIGAWRKAKGVNFFAPIMRALGNRYELIFTGGSAVSAKERAIFPSNMQDIGRLDEPSVIDALRSAHVLLFPSRSEGFGLVAAEAMACGLPVIACRNTALEDLVEHKITGFLCSTDKISCFVDSIRSICNDPALYQKQSQAARQIALARFSIQKMVDEYAAEYQKLCAN